MPPEQITTVTLVGGPFDGQEFAIANPHRGILIEGAPLEDGMVARYGLTRDHTRMKFRGLDRIVYRQPGPQPGGPS